MKDLVALLVIVYFVMWLIGIGTQFAARRRLRSLYPEIAARVAPGLLQKSLASDFSWLRFIIRREYRSLDRRSFVRLCDFYLLMMVAFAVVFAVTIVLFVYCSARRLL